MFRIAAPLLCSLALIAAPAAADAESVSRTVTTEVRADGTVVTTTTTITEYVEEWEVQSGASSRFVDIPLPERGEALASYGPFSVLDGKRAALTGVTDSGSPAQFARLLAAHPGIEVLEFHDCPGTFDDLANLRLARMIRANGLTTHVPLGGSVRSGAVELFLGGARRRIDDGAEFAVHAWEDEDGLQASDYALTAQANAKYLAFYREMGMSESDALAFYAMTNSVPYEEALWLDANDMRGWLGMAAAEPALDESEPRLAYLDLGAALN